MKELQDLIKRVEAEINETPSGNLRNLLCDANITLQKQALILPVVSQQSELLKVLEYTRQIKSNPKDIQLIVDKLYVENL